MAANPTPRSPAPSEGQASFLDHPNLAFLRYPGFWFVAGLALVCGIIITTPREWGQAVGLPTLPTAAIITPGPTTAAPATDASGSTTDEAPAEKALTFGPIDASTLPFGQGVIAPLGGEKDVPAFWQPGGGEEATRLEANVVVNLLERRGMDWVAVQNQFMAQPLWVATAVVNAPNTDIQTLKDTTPRPTAVPPQAAPAWVPQRQAQPQVQPQVEPTAAMLATMPPEATAAPAPTAAAAAPTLQECVHTGGGGMCPARPMPTMNPDATWPAQITWPPAPAATAQP